MMQNDYFTFVDYVSDISAQLIFLLPLSIFLISSPETKIPSKCRAVPNEINKRKRKKS